MREKAYKILAIQEGISNSKAKDLIDKGRVTLEGKKVTVARGEVDVKSYFKIKKVNKAEVLFEDKFIVAVDKPAYVVSEDLQRDFDAVLLHRLDKETSGVILLVKDEEFRLKAIKEFKQRRVYKEYEAYVSGMFAEEKTVEKPLLTIKNNGKAYSKIADKGKEAISKFIPMEVEGKISKVKAIIETGRTHQIRVHLSSIGHSIIGDTKYGGAKADRLLLHARRIKIFDYDISSKMDFKF